MSKESSSGYELGKFFYTERIKRLKEILPTTKGNVYNEISIKEDIELSKLKSEHLDRRKENGLLK